MKAQLTTVLLLALFSHGLGLANGFVYDDHRFVDGNPALARVSVADAFLDAATQTADLDRDVYRPLRLLGHAWDLRHWGLDPFGFHLHSLIVHLLNVLLAYVVLRHLLGSERDEAAFVGAALLATHPLGVEVVGWISSRGDLYAAGFGLVALGLGCVRRAKPGVLVLAASAACLATLGKESAAVLPVVAGLHVLLVGRHGGSPVDPDEELVGHESKRRLHGVPWGPLALALGVLAALTLRQVALAGASPVQTPPHGGSALAQAAWALFGLSQTLASVVFPANLCVEYPQDSWAAGAIPVWIRPATLLGVGVLVLPILWARLGRRRAAFLAAWALLAYLPSSSFLVTLRDLVNDRGAYPMLPALGALLGLACGGRRAAAWLVVLGLGIPLAFASVERTAAFRSDTSLWSDVLVKNPGSVRAHLGLAAVSSEELVQRAHLIQATQNCVAGSKLEAAALARLGQHLLRSTGNAEAALPVLEKALEAARYWQALERPTTDAETVAAALAEAYELLGRSGEAEQVLDLALADAAAQPATGRSRATVLLVHRALVRLLRLQRDPSSEEKTKALWEAVLAAETAAPEHPLVTSLRALIAQRMNEASDSR